MSDSEDRKSNVKGESAVTLEPGPVITEPSGSSEIFDSGLLQKLFSFIVDSQMMAITVWDLTGRILWANDEFLRLTGYSQSDLQRGIYMDRITPSEWCDADQATVQDLLKGRQSQAFEKEYFARDGSRVAVMVQCAMQTSPSPRGLSVIFDLRARKRLQTIEQQMQQMQKLDTIGRLAGGVAHGFNNLLMIILSNVQLTQEMLPQSIPVQKNLTEVVSACDRAADLTQQLLAFGRRQLQRVEDLDLSEVVGETVNFARQVIGGGVELRFQQSGMLGRIRADRGHISQIIINLCLNARDVLEPGGVIDVTLSQHILREGGERSPLLPPGPYSLLEVHDNGSGMDASVRERLFEPFFTTKETMQSRGLGLSAVYGIVKQNAGFIFVDSEPGRGTTFSIYFPETQQPEEALGFELEHQLCNGTILLVEDEEPLRIAIKRHLMMRGYNALEACDGKAALKLLEDGASFDLMLSDMVMPRMGGLELAQQMRQSLPRLPIIFMSGYSEMTEAHRLPSPVSLLFKPFSMANLDQQIRSSLAANPQAERIRQ